MYGVPGIPLIGTESAAPIPPVPLEQPKNLFRFGEQCIWSTQLMTAGTAIANTQFRLFATPIGQQGQGFTTALTISETNQKEGGRVPNGIAYDVFGVAAQVMDGTSDTNIGAPVDTLQDVTNIATVIHNGVLTWDFTQTYVDICPMLLAGAGGGIYGAISTTVNNTSVGNLQNGNGSIWMYRKHPVALPGSSTFAILIRMGSRAQTPVTTGVAVRIVLLGYYKNVIEIG